MQRIDNTDDHGRRGQGAGGVVDHNQFRLADGRERASHRLCAAVPAGDNGRSIADDQFGLVGAVGRDGDYDGVDGSGFVKTGKRPLEHCATA
jgi:hypothetical protein